MDVKLLTLVAALAVVMYAPPSQGTGKIILLCSTCAVVLGLLRQYFTDVSVTQIGDKLQVITDHLIIVCQKTFGILLFKKKHKSKIYCVEERFNARLLSYYSKMPNNSGIVASFNMTVL